jgi:Zn-dependent protease
MGVGFVATFYLATGLGLQPGIFALGVWFNAWIAVFNLIPFMGLDGAKILSWSKLAWVLTLAGAIGMFLLAESLIGGIFLPF